MRYALPIFSLCDMLHHKIFRTASKTQIIILLVWFFIIPLLVVAQVMLIYYVQSNGIYGQFCIGTKSRIKKA